MKLEKLAGATSEIWQMFIRDSSSTTGGGLTGLTNASASLTAYYHRDTDTTATAISLVSMTVGTFTSSGFKEIDATNMPGWYQFCPPNAAIASGAKSCAFHLKGATNMAPLPIEVQLVAVNPDSANAFMTGVNGNAYTGDAYARLGAPAGASVSADVAAVNAKTTNLPASPAAIGSAMTLTAAYDAAKTASQAGDAMALTSSERNSTADAILGRNVAGGSSTGRLVKEALYVLRNKVDAQLGNVYGTDDSTVAFTFSVTTAAGNPIAVYDPA